MFISRLYRINTSILPGQYLSVIVLSENSGDDVSVAEVANTVHSDRDALDGIVFVRDDGEILDLDGVHTMIREIRPPHMKVILETSGSRPEVLDDLVGAGYVNHVIFRFDSLPDIAQKRSLSIAASGDCIHSAILVMDHERFDSDTILENRRLFDGSSMIFLKRTESRGAVKQYRKNEMTSLAKALKGTAREILVL